MRRHIPLLIVCSLAFGALGRAQTPPQPAQTAPAAPPANPPVEAGAQAPAPAGYSYNPEGRRDPFLSLLGRGNDPRDMATRAPGLPGLLIGELTVKGILRDRTGFIAMVQAPDSKTYIVRAGEKLLDGAVKSISQDTVVFSQDVNDPLSLVKQREVRKGVRASDGRGSASQFE